MYIFQFLSPDKSKERFSYKYLVSKRTCPILSKGIDALTEIVEAAHIMLGYSGLFFYLREILSHNLRIIIRSEVINSIFIEHIFMSMALISTYVSFHRENTEK